MKIIFLVSGGGGSFKFTNELIQKEKFPIEISYVIADRECGAIEYARAENIPNAQISYNRNNNTALFDLLRNLNPDLIITNIHKIIDEKTLALFENRFINLHYSLLPAFGGFIGMKTVEEAAKSNVQFLGATCHYVNDQLDAGKIISQSAFAVDWQQPMELIQDTVFQSACLILANAIVTHDGKHSHTKAIKSLQINSNEVIFNPSLQFSIEHSNAIFEQLRSA